MVADQIQARALFQGVIGGVVALTFLICALRCFANIFSVSEKLDSLKDVHAKNAAEASITFSAVFGLLSGLIFLVALLVTFHAWGDYFAPFEHLIAK